MDTRAQDLWTGTFVVMVVIVLLAVIATGCGGEETRSGAAIAGDAGAEVAAAAAGDAGAELAAAAPDAIADAMANAQPPACPAEVNAGVDLNNAICGGAPVYSQGFLCGVCRVNGQAVTGCRLESSFGGTLWLCVASCDECTP